MLFFFMIVVFSRKWGVFWKLSILSICCIVGGLGYFRVIVVGCLLEVTGLYI